MLPKTNRISKKELAVATPPFRFTKSDYFTIRYRSNQLSTFRCSIIVSKKIDKRAVMRNRLKRRISGALSEIGLDQKGKDILIYLKKPVQELSREELKGQLQKVLRAL
jgi:ribonuclease P protein component